MPYLWGMLVLKWVYIGYRVHGCGLLVGSAMDGYSAMHTCAVTTQFADKKKRSSYFYRK